VARSRRAAEAALPREVRNLGLVSLLTDASSEMIYPLLPSFVTGTLRAGPAVLGTIEGLAEATAALLKLVSGRLADRLPHRKPLVVAGYGLSSLVRPLVALASSSGQVLAIRLLDRLGKGVRSPPRDALLADVTAESQRGRAFGFHRAMDHAGALVGPLLASLVLLATDDLRLVFALAAVPAALAMAALVFGVREPMRQVLPKLPDVVPTREARHVEPGPPRAPALAGTGAHSPADDGAADTRAVAVGSRRLRRYLAVLAVFSLGNSSDAFLLLRAQEAGVGLAALPLLWSLHHLVKAGASTAGGTLSDRFGRRRLILAGWVVYAVAYAGFAWMSTPLEAFLWFAFYGVFHALTEGPERALLSNLAGPAERGRAFGLYHAVTGAMLLPASLLTGGLWQAFGASVALGAGAALAAAAACGLWLLVPEARSV
jgi:MFS family permease